MAQGMISPASRKRERRPVSGCVTFHRIPRSERTPDASTDMPHRSNSNDARGINEKEETFLCTPGSYSLEEFADKIVRVHSALTFIKEINPRLIRDVEKKTVPSDEK